MSLQQSASKKIPLNSFSEKTQNLEVFELKAKATFTPIDFNIFALTETMNWSLSDRMRFWYPLKKEEKLPERFAMFDVGPHLLLRKLDREDDSFCLCHVSLDGEVLIRSNDSNYAEEFFIKVFVNVPPSFHELSEWEISKQWIQDPEIVAFFCGSLDGAMGWTDRIPAGISRSIDEAKANYDLKKWNPCVVMCRRALEETMQFAYQRFFKQDAKGLKFNEIVRKFERDKPDVIPKHWISVLDSVRLIGNVPGAHPEKKEYKYSRVDADVALLQTVSFLEAYLSKIDKDVDSVYTLKIDVNDEKEESR